MKTTKTLLAAATLGLALLTAPREAAAQLAIIGTFNAPAAADGQLQVATFAKDSKIIALMGIKKPGSNNVSFSFSSGVWSAFRDACLKLPAVETKKWMEVISLSEEGDDANPSHLLVYAGHETIQFVVTNPARGTNNYLLPRSDLPAFLEKAGAVKELLDKYSAAPAP